MVSWIAELKRIGVWLQGTDRNALHADWDTRWVNHSVAFMNERVCTNQAESYFSRLRCMKMRTYHHIAGSYRYVYAGEAPWRDDNRRIFSGRLGVAAMASCVSRQRKGIGGGVSNAKRQGSR